MKAIRIFIAILAAYSSAAFSAEPSPACLAKQQSIESKISEATARGRTHEAAGLRRALEANKAHCTDEYLAEERDEDIRKARAEVKEREEDLREAQRDGDAAKIATNALGTFK